MSEQKRDGESLGPPSTSLSRLYLDQGVNFDRLIHQTKTPRMKEVLEMARRWTKLSDPILIIGETGVGKNMLAQAIHNERGLAGFHEVTCTGIPETLFESEIFGHKKGSFTGAVSDKVGLAKQAHGGTLFLDEIGELSLALQAKLLRLVEQKRFYPVGSDTPIETDIHIICATNKTLEELRDPEHFRSDLFYRMPLCISLPPLRERREDLQRLISHFFDEYAKEGGKADLLMGTQTLDLLLQYGWPGNIRELKFAIKRAVFSALGEEEVAPSHLPEWITSRQSTGMTLAQVEKNHILHVLDLTRGDMDQAAEILEIGRSTLYRKVGEYKKEDGE